MIFRILLALYDVATSAATWVILVPAALLSGDDRRVALDRCFGRFRATLVPGRPRVVLHAVSAGETMAAASLVRELSAACPGASVVLTSGNGDGLRMASRLRSLLPAVGACVPLPWDRRGAVRRWLRQVRPDAVVVVETELWPNLFVACREEGVPLFVASGRLDPGDVRRYRLARAFFGPVLACAEWIGVQRPGEAAGFVAIGAPPDRVSVAGDLKYDSVTAPAAFADEWVKLLHGVRPIVCGSTHAPEEEMLCRAYSDVRAASPDTRLILVPRHVRRAGEIERLTERCGLTSSLWSAGAAKAASRDVLIVDELGWLVGLYRVAEVAVLGGTIGGRGAQNVLEPAAAGCAILCGAHVRNVSAAQELADAGALRMLSRWCDAHEIAGEIVRLLTHDTEREDLGRRARLFTEARRGPAARHVAEILRRLRRVSREARDVRAEAAVETGSS
jgi:3-deoxy-D-manno-octulosonic-acid transferase